MKALVFSDLHLKYGSPYDREPGDRLEDQVLVGQRIVEIAREYGCGLMVNGGDSLDGSVVQTEAFMAWHRIFGDCEIPIVTITGNNTHDAGRRKVKAPEIAGLSGDMTVASRAEVVFRAGVAVACLPWCSAGHLIAANGEKPRGEINQWMAGLLVEVARKLKAECVECYLGLPHVLLGHWGLEGAATESGIEIERLTEPWLPIADLEALGFDLVAFGHIHPPKLLSALTAPPVISIGAPMQFKFGERGERGVWIFDTETGAAEFVPIASRRFIEVAYPDAAVLIDDLQEGEIADLDVANAIVKIRYTATAEQAKRIDQRKLRDALYAAGARKVYAIEADVQRETRARDRSLDTSLTELEALDRWAEADGTPPAMQARMRETLAGWIEEEVA